MSHWTHDQWGDFITISSVFLAFLAMTYYAIRRTWRWDRLGVALTGVTLSLASLFGIASYVTLFGGGLWLLHVRWLVRAVLTAVSIYATVVMATDEPPKGDRP